MEAISLSIEEQKTSQFRVPQNQLHIKFPKKFKYWCSALTLDQ